MYLSMYIVLWYWTQIGRFNIDYMCILLIKPFKNKSRSNFINNLLSATYFGFVSHLQAEYRIVVRTVYYTAVSGLDELSYIIMEYYKK